jgi:preprotein translocase subunit SecY
LPNGGKIDEEFPMKSLFKAFFACNFNISTIFALGIASEVEPIHPAVPFSKL